MTQTTNPNGRADCFNDPRVRARHREICEHNFRYGWPHRHEREHTRQSLRLLITMLRRVQD